MFSSLAKYFFSSPNTPYPIPSPEEIKKLVAEAFAEDALITHTFAIYPSHFIPPPVHDLKYFSSTIRRYHGNIPPGFSYVVVRPYESSLWPALSFTQLKNAFKDNFPVHKDNLHVWVHVDSIRFLYNSTSKKVDILPDQIDDDLVASHVNIILLQFGHQCMEFGRGPVLLDGSFFHPSVIFALVADAM